MVNRIPKWVDIALIPALNLALAFFVSGLVLLMIGENPIEVLTIMLRGAFGSVGWGYTLFYATNFIFTGLAVAVAFQAKLFNIGGEGQAQLGALGVALVCLAIPWPHWALALPFAVLGGALFGAAWAALPAYLQAKRGSHIVITTIMFNFIASAVLIEVLRSGLKAPGSVSPESARFPAGTFLPQSRDIAEFVGLSVARTPLNISFVIAILAAIAVWLLIWHTRLGYEIRAFGQSEPAARYAGISGSRIIIVTMLISGGLAGLMAINAVMGEQQRLLQENVLGAGFVGIAVALMGRSHPFGVCLAALLFGALTQGGAELQFETSIPPQLILVIQALVILFTGALDNMVRDPVTKLFRQKSTTQKMGGL